MKERTYQDIVHGERVMFHDLKPDDYQDTFESLKFGYFLGQERMNLPEVDMVGGLEVYSKTPELHPESDHLCRPTVLKSGITKTIDYPTDEERLVLVREQLRRSLNDRA